MTVDSLSLQKRMIGFDCTCNHSKPGSVGKFFPNSPVVPYDKVFCMRRLIYCNLGLWRKKSGVFIRAI